MDITITRAWLDCPGGERMRILAPHSVNELTQRVEALVAIGLLPDTSVVVYNVELTLADRAVVSLVTTTLADIRCLADDLRDLPL